jgi:hypothetical protein
LADKQMRFTDAHPDVRAARDAVAQAESRLAGFGPRTVAAPAAPRTEISIAPRVRAEARSSGAPAPAQTKAKNGERDLVALETEWSRLTRAVTESRQRHDQVEAALFKAEIAANSASDTTGAQMTVIDPAFLPQRPVPPGPKTIAAGFGALALMLGSLLALGFAAVDDRIYDRRGASGLGYVLVEVPRVRRRRLA